MTTGCCWLKSDHHHHHFIIIIIIIITIIIIILFLNKTYIFYKYFTNSGGRGFDSHRGQKIFSLPRVVPCFPLLGITPSGLFMGLSSTIIYTSELILCSTICVPSATRHNIHMYPYFLFAAIYHLKSSPSFSVRPCSSVGRVTEDLIRRSWVRFPPRSKDFFFASCGSLFPCLLGLTPSGLFMGLSSTIIYIFYSLTGLRKAMLV